MKAEELGLTSRMEMRILILVARKKSGSVKTDVTMADLAGSVDAIGKGVAGDIARLSTDVCRVSADLSRLTVKVSVDMSQLSSKMDRRFDRVDDRLAKHDVRFDVLEKKVDGLDRKVERSHLEMKSRDQRQSPRIAKLERVI